jgi:hypothetical protein
MFETRKASLQKAGQSTCFVGVQPGVDFAGKPTAYGAGTAFFVGPKTLVTAGHLVPDNKRKIMAQIPGTRPRTLFVENLFNKPKFEVIECKCIGTGYPNADISILQVVGPYVATTYLQIEPLMPKDEDRTSVDVVGYPGLYDEYYIQSMHDAAIEWEAVNDVLDLFPKHELVITHGPIVDRGIMPTYRLSTVTGMSGSPVLFNGKVIGKSSG